MATAQLRRGTASSRACGRQAIEIIVGVDGALRRGAESPREPPRAPESPGEPRRAPESPGEPRG
eukprot:411749-Alexandrium_andersonii.AAC.1